jgi:hypothetical protein
MTVSELIAELQKLPQDATVHIVDYSPDNTKWDNEVRDIILNKDNTVDLDNWPSEGY